MPLPILMQAAQFVGIFGMSALAVFVFSAPALIATGRGARTGLALAALLAVAVVGYGYAGLFTAGSAERFLQARIVQIGSGNAGFEESFRAHLDLSGAPSVNGDPAPRLILWPELAIPAILAESPDLLKALGDAVKEGQVLLAGTIRDEGGDTGERRLYEAVVAVGAGGAIGDAVDRTHFPPFAPLLRLAGMGDMLPEDVFAGSGARSLSLPGSIKAVALIGTEAAIPGIAARHAANADLIVDLADYARFAGTPGPHQHLRQAQLRAVEAGLPMIVAMPNGVSAAIDGRGRMIDAFASGGRGALDVSLPMEKPNFFDMTHFDMGNIKTRGLTFVIFFGMLPLLSSIRGRSN